VTGIRILMAAGGTGGHIMPAVAAAQAIRQLDPAAEFLFVGAGRPAEEAVLGPGGWERASVNAAPIKGKGPLAKAKGVFRAVSALFQAAAIVRRFKPDLVFGAGGYSSGPVGLAARLSGVPLFIHEQNRRPGLTNRLLARLSSRVFLGDPGAAGHFARAKTLYVGNPVRPEIFADSPKEPSPGKPFTLLVLGGSQGAESLNRAVGSALAGLKGLGGVRVIHQAGAAGEKSLRPLYEASGLDFELGAFFTDMARLYREADLALCRAGALTLAELAAAGAPSALVPLPWAADDHQTRNAEAFEEAGAALTVPEKALTGEKVVSLVEGFLDVPGRLARMSKAAMGLARRDSAARMAAEIYAAASARRARSGRKGVGMPRTAL
jgi:UDP-N-acetylglucosamine--N-acetylmuramyl-(pentapeptide) pyrophosphoryl-undecaprenol N-acetylglucosamine transferase